MPEATVPEATVPDPDGPVLAVTSLRKEFGGLVAVDDVSFDVRAGRSMAIVGESGSGKTTIARMIVGLERPTGGTITACGADRSRPARSAHDRGIVGFKPPYGRVPEVEIFNLDHYCHEGPMARTVADCALIENVIAGPDPSDVASLRPKLEIPARLEPISGMRIALSPDLGCYEVDADVAANTRAAAGRLRDAGATVTEVSLPWRLDMIAQAARIHFGMIFGPSIRELYEQHGAELTSYARHFAAEAADVAKDDFLTGLELESRIYAPLGALLAEFDALICPTFAIPALPAEYDVADQITVNGMPSANWMDVMMTLPFNIASRCPVLSVPSGLSRDGVPTGLSIVGKTYDDVTAFRVAAAHEERFPWLDQSSRRPAL